MSVSSGFLKLSSLNRYSGAKIARRMKLLPVSLVTERLDTLHQFKKVGRHSTPQHYGRKL
jgi:hypothetical protein